MLTACSGDLEREWGDPQKRGYTPNQRTVFTNSTSQVPVQTAAVQSMPSAGMPARPVTQSAPVYNAPRTVYVTTPPQQQIVTNSIPNATPVPVYSQPMPPIVQANAQPVPVSASSNRVPVSVPVTSNRVDYTATASVKPNVLGGPPVVVSRFDSMPKAAPHKNQSRVASYRRQPVAAAPQVDVPVAYQPMPPKPVEQKRRFSISKFFSLPKSSPKPKAVDYRSTASIQPPAAIQPQTSNAPVTRKSTLNQQGFTAPRTSGHWTSAGGSMITALPGDDIQSLSRRYGVPEKAIADINGLVDQSFIAPGQQLIIPVYQQAHVQPTQPVQQRQPQKQVQNSWQSPTAQSSSIPTMPIALRVPKANPLRLQAKTPYAQRISRYQQQANAQNRHMVMAGDTLSGIASRYGVSTRDLARANGLSPNSRIRMGQRLKIPQKGVDYTSTASINRQPTVLSAVQQQKKQSPLRLSKLPKVKPRSISSAKSKVTRQKVASLKQPVGLPDKVMSDVPTKPAAKRVATKDLQFRWPVRGRIISNYGRKRDGGRNDGINLAVPEGTAVRVAESGTVIYAGDKLKGYGNLVLVQHSNGYVTAYAHNDRVMVNKGQQVRRGQIISQAGRSGDVDSPQLHFELRIKGDPVDPVPYLVSS